MRGSHIRTGAVICAVVLSLAWGTGARAQGPDEAYEYAREKYLSLVSSPERMEWRESWEDVIDTFLVVVLDHPDSERADDALYMVGILYRDLYNKAKNPRDLNLSLEAFVNLVDNYPTSNLADDGLLVAGDISLHLLDEGGRAYCLYARLVREYPEGDMVDDARERIAGLDEASVVSDCMGDGVDESAGVEFPAPREIETSLAVTDESPTVDGPVVGGLRYHTGPEYTRLVLDLDDEGTCSFGMLPPDEETGLSDRLFVDIPGATWPGADSEPTIINDDRIEKVRIGAGGDKTLRLVLDLTGPKVCSVFTLSSPDRIVIDVFSEEEDVASAPWKETEDASGDAGNDTAGEDVAIPTPEKEAQKRGDLEPVDITVVVLDPGHGGKDPGAVGPTGYYEKTANLKIAKYLKEYIEDRLGLVVIMTRTDDTYLSLKERTAIANDRDADLFISLHNNANKSSSPYGISTYYLSVTSDEKALGVAARENFTTVEKLSELDIILTDLMVSAKRNESSLLGTFVQNGMVAETSDTYDKINDMGVLPGPFWVLVGAQMPSILIEGSFISNTREEKRLQDEEYLKALADGICDGVEKYITEINTARMNW
ncbi:MAG: N-acetylmuramoyl-L-alanine amidase [Deltaproteobacteria bacterium]|nr:N-acetylmuramoyl-L-alanine amidase [Candidatus Zymogenaceae bacterium]